MSNKKIVEHIKVYEDLQFGVLASQYTHHIDFKVYDIVGFSHPDNKPHYGPYGDPLSETTENINEASEECIFLHGQVKWDGCSDWYFCAQDICMIHGCTKADITRIGTLLGNLYDFTKETLPSFLD